MSIQSLHAHRRHEAEKTLWSYAAYNRQAYWDIVTVFLNETQFLRRLHHDHWLDDVHRLARLCGNMTARHRNWFRSPSTWRPASGSNFGLMRSFVEHVFVEYPVPNHLASLWQELSTGSQELDVYCRLARGESLRKMQLPRGISLCKSEARCFMTAPDDASWSQAVCFAKVHALGIGPRLSVLIMRSIDSDLFNGNEQAWTDLMRFFVRHQDLADEEVRQIMAQLGVRKTGRPAGPF